jgi:hypothetical protein
MGRFGIGGMIEFGWEKWSNLILEVMPLFIRYWNEEGILFGKELPMDPDFQGASMWELAGRLRIFTARRDLKLIGVNGFNCGGTLFRARIIVANGLILYLVPEERRRPEKIGKSLIVGAESGLREIGTRLIVYTPSSTVDVGPLLERLGYSRRGSSYEKML